jgi:UDP-N-acetyl-2-amino-2-deoxyglucuronate dehydrogenase
MGEASSVLRSVVVGLRMGRRHAQVMDELPEYQVVGVCDLDAARAAEVASELSGSKAYTDYEKMLAAEKPDVVTVATPTDSHARFTIMAVEAGARGVCCEKPMAVSLGEGRAMIAACAEHGTSLIVAHQRRMGPDLMAMRQLIDQGAIGEVYLLRGSCQGDLLSDGTHLVDSLRWLAGDEEISWVLGQAYREPPDPGEEKAVGFHRSGGYRYGHMVETGAMATFEFKSGLRAEILTGEARFPGREYQDYEVFGTEGRLWRLGDRVDPPLRIWDEQAGGWRELTDYPGCPTSDARINMYMAFACAIHEKTSHPLSGESGLADLEVLIATFESARTHSMIRLPLQQEAFPLPMMID